MPTFTVPSSYGTLQEYNHCHHPSGSGKGGQFCGVGITSFRPGKTNREVFGADMASFARDLRAITSVQNVRVAPGQGGWEGVPEPTWVVSYQGNGAARRLMVRTAQRFNQSGVLIMHGGCRGRRCDPAVDYRFDRGVGAPQRDLIQQALMKHGISGWTWLKSEGKTVLRFVSVKGAGGSRAHHLRAARRISADIAKLGIGHRTKIKGVRTELIEQKDYAAVLGERG